MNLSILIPTVDSRKDQLRELTRHIYSQIVCLKAGDQIEVRINSDRGSLKGGMTTGKKRNDLLSEARGEYCWFIDDDDWIIDNALELVMTAINPFAGDKPDVIGINGWMTTDGGNKKEWEIRIGHPYTADYSKGYERYLRYPNHITPMKTAIARQIGFPMQNNFEDKKFADDLLKSGLLKTQVIITEPIYHYRFSHANKTYK